MDNFVKTLISCYNNRHQTDAYNTISDFPDSAGMTIVLGKILVWLKLEYKRQEWKKTRKYISGKPLKLDPEYEWCKNIIWLVNNNTYFNKYFAVAENNLIVNPQISEAETAKALTTVFENFKTPLFS